ncbi:MAG: hypothetical protein PHR53_01320 [Bacteroidales bacterium]|nr:hypothetical protein [Bacteroidales bacterium]
MNYELILNVGFAEAKIGMTIEDVEKLFGKPNEIEKVEDDFYEDDREIYYFNDLHVFPIIETKNKTVVGIMCDHPDVTLNGQKLFGWDIDEFVHLFHGKDGIEVETEEDDAEGIVCYIQDCEIFFEDEKSTMLMIQP